MTRLDRDPDINRIGKMRTNERWKEQRAVLERDHAKNMLIASAIVLTVIFMIAAGSSHTLNRGEADAPAYHSPA